MTPDDFPDVTPTNRYHVQRPKEAFGSMAEASLDSSEEADEEVQPTMQLRCELQISNTGGCWQPLIFVIICTGTAALEQRAEVGLLPG